MTATSSPRKAWAKNLAEPAPAFDPTRLPVVSGHIPPELQGTLYRNGPGRLSRGGQTVGHWFDGDGAILAVHFHGGEATGLYRYVQTDGYVAEEKANHYLFGNYGMKDPQGLWNYWGKMIRQRDVFKNVANTSVMALPDRLLALWEGAEPYALDLDDLTTLGRESFDGKLPPAQPFSAHPLKDPGTGDIFSIGVDLQFNLNLYRLNAAGKLLKHTKIKLAQTPFCHSFCLAGQYLIFFLPPITLDQLPLLLNQKPYADALGWDAAGSTKVLVIDRDSFEIVSQGETDPWFQWHYGNGCVLPDGNVRLDFVRFPDFIQTNEYLREVPTGRTKTVSQGHLWQVILNPFTAQILSKTPILERSCEFPVVNPHLTGQDWRYTYVALQRSRETSGAEWFGAIARVDYQSEQILEADLGANQYPMEPLYIAHPTDPELGWIITVVYDGDRHQSEVWIWDQARLDQDPVCRLGLPSVIPFGFHGTWRAS